MAYDIIIGAQNLSVLTATIASAIKYSSTAARYAENDVGAYDRSMHAIVVTGFAKRYSPFVGQGAPDGAGILRGVYSRTQHPLSTHIHFCPRLT